MPLPPDYHPRFSLLPGATPESSEALLKKTFDVSRTLLEVVQGMNELDAYLRDHVQPAFFAGHRQLILRSLLTCLNQLDDSLVSLRQKRQFDGWIVESRAAVKNWTQSLGEYGRHIHPQEAADILENLVSDIRLHRKFIIETLAKHRDIQVLRGFKGLTDQV